VFVGHFGIGLAAKAAVPRVSLGTLFLSVQLADGLWLVLPGIWLVALLGPPPPSESALAWSALAAWLFVPWGYWIDRHRAVRSVS
jgi:hypothetical protein